MKVWKIEQVQTVVVPVRHMYYMNIIGTTGSVKAWYSVDSTQWARKMSIDPNDCVHTKLNIFIYLNHDQAAMESSISCHSRMNACQHSPSCWLSSCECSCQQPTDASAA